MLNERCWSSLSWDSLSLRLAFWKASSHTSGSTQFTSNPSVSFRARNITRTQTWVGSLNLTASSTRHTGWPCMVFLEPWWSELHALYQRFGEDCVSSVSRTVVIVCRFLQKTHDPFFVLRRSMAKSGSVGRSAYHPQLFRSGRSPIDLLGVAAGNRAVSCAADQKHRKGSSVRSAATALSGDTSSGSNPPVFASASMAKMDAGRKSVLPRNGLKCSPA